MSNCKNKKRSKIKLCADKIKFELRCINMKAALTGAVCVLLLGIASMLFGGSPVYMLKVLNLPDFLPTRWFFKVAWTLAYLLAGGAFGAVMGCSERYKQIYKYKGSMLFILYAIFNYIWYPLFFGAEAIFLSVVAVAAMIILSFFVMKYYFKVYFICGSVMLLHILWLVYLFLLNVVILFIN